MILPMIKCRYRKPRTSRDEPETEWISGMLMQFVCDQEGFIHAIVAHEDGSLGRANYDRVQLVRVDDGRTPQT